MTALEWLTADEIRLQLAYWTAKLNKFKGQPWNKKEWYHSQKQTRYWGRILDIKIERLGLVK